MRNIFMFFNIFSIFFLTHQNTIFLSNFNNYSCIATSTCDGSLSNPFNDFNLALTSGYQQLLGNISINTLNFSFISDNFTISANTLYIQAFYQWESLLSRNITIYIYPDGCGVINSECGRNFTIFLKTQNFSFYSVSNIFLMNIIFEAGDSAFGNLINQTKPICYNIYNICCKSQNFNISGDICYIGNMSSNSIIRSSDPDRSLFEMTNSYNNLTIFNVKLNNLYAIDKSQYYSYIFRLSKLAISINMFILNCEFKAIYVKNSLVKISSNSSIFVQNTSFIDYNPFNFIENITAQIFSYVISVDNTLSNLTINNCSFYNIQFILYSNGLYTSILKSIVYIRIRTTTYLSSLSTITGLLNFAANIFITIKNTSFYQTPTPQYNIKGINRFSLILTSDKSNIYISDCLFINLTIRDARVFLATSNSAISLISNKFLNINHTCYESATSSCLYYLFDISSNNNIFLANNSFSNIFINTDKEFIRILSLNNVTFINNTMKNMQIINNPTNFLITFFSSNNISIISLMAKVYNIGYSGGFFSFDNKNLIFINNSIFSASNPSTTAGQIVYLSSTNVLYCFQVYFANMTDLFRNCMYILSSNSVYYNRCYLYNLTGARGGASSLANNYNQYTINNSVVESLNTITFGALVYVISQNNTVNIISTIILTLYALQEGAVTFVETSHTLIIKDTVIFGTYANMYGGIISSLNTNTIVINNTIVIQTQSQSNGGVINILQNNVINVFNSSFIGCSSSKSQAGVLYSYQNNTVIFTNILFFNNSAEQEGGSFFFDNNNYFYLTYSGISYSYSSSDAGFLMAKVNNKIFIKYCDFSETFAVLDGGFIKLQKYNNITLSDITIEYSSSQQNGGVFYLDTGNIFNLTNTVIFSTQGVKGGIFSFSIKNQVFLTNCSFEHSKASFQGGGIFADNTNFIKIITCTFTSIINIVGDGGLLYLNYNNILIMENSDISNISSIGYGGYMYSFQNNSIFSRILYISHIFSFVEGSFICLNYNNSIYINESYIEEKEGFIGMIYIMNNNMYILENTLFFIRGYMENSYMVYLGFMNVGEFNNVIFEIFIGKNSEIVRYFRLEEKSVMILNRSDIKFDICDKLFEVYKFSNITLISFNLTNFSTSTTSFIDISSSYFQGFYIYLHNNTIALTFYITNSSIKLTYFQYFIKYQQNSLFLHAEDSSTIELKKGEFRRNIKNDGNTLIINNSKLNLIKVFVIGFANSGYAVFSNSSLIIIKSLFLMNVNSLSGGVFSLIYENTSTFIVTNNIISITHSVISNNKALYNGSFIYMLNNNGLLNKIEVIIEKNRFLMNTAWNGGVLYLINFEQFSMNSAKFLKNQAFINNPSLVSKGGVLYSKNQEISSKINIFANNFTLNTADIGGVIYTEGLEIENINYTYNKYLKNSANYYGNNLASETYELRIYTLSKELSANNAYNDDKFFSYTIPIAIKSGYNYTKCIVSFNGYDRFGSITYETDEILNEKIYTIQRNPENMLLFYNSFDFSMQNGFICLKDNLIRGQIPLKMSFTYEIISLLPKNFSLWINMNFKSCDIGERLTENNECIPCASGTYSFQRYFLQFSELCKTCNGMNFNCFGGGNYTPKPGYWRGSTESTVFYKCLNPNACVGDDRNQSLASTVYMDIYSSRICAQGYGDTLCSLCQEGYGITDAFTCVTCQSSNYYLQVFGNLILRILFALYLINISLNMCLTLMTDKPNHSRVIATNLLKILTNHMQILGIILKFPISIPDQITSGASIFLSITPNVSEAFSIQCVLQKVGLNFSILYFKLVCAGIYPLILVLFYLIFLKFISAIKCKKPPKSPTTSPSKHTITLILQKKTINHKELILTIFSLVCLTCYADISNMSLAMFGCVKIDDGNTVVNLLYNDMSVNCDSSYHQNYIKKLSVPIIIFFLALYPLYIVFNIFINLYYNKGIKAPKFYFKFGYFFFAYQKRFFFWDFVILIRKLLLIFVNHFFFSNVSNDTSSYYSIIVVLLIITLAFMLQNYCKPFLLENFYFINNVEEASLMISFLTVCCLLIIISSPELNSQISSFLFISGILLNLWFFYWWIKHYYKFYFKRKFASWISMIGGLNKRKQAEFKIKTNIFGGDMKSGKVIKVKPSEAALKKSISKSSEKFSTKKMKIEEI